MVLHERKILLRWVFIAFVVLGLLVSVVLIQQRTRFLPKATGQTSAVVNEANLAANMGKHRGEMAPNVFNALNRDGDNYITLADYALLQQLASLGWCPRLRDKIQLAMGTGCGDTRYDYRADIVGFGGGDRDGAVSEHDWNLFKSKWNDESFCDAAVNTTSDVCAGGLPSVQLGPNLIQKGDFESGDLVDRLPWSTWGGLTGNDATFDIVTSTKASGEKSAHITITAASSEVCLVQNNVDHRQFQDKKASFKIWYKASSPTSSVILKYKIAWGTSGSHDNFDYKSINTLSTNAFDTYQTITDVTFPGTTPPETLTRVFPNICFSGARGNELWLDNIELRLITPSSS